MLRTFAALGAVLLASGCGHVATPTRAIRVGSIRQPATLDPMRGGQYMDNFVAEALFSGLTVIDDRARVAPDLAQAVPTRANGGVSADGRTLTYKLRPHLVWSDGVPLTARDVVFTYRLLTTPATNFPSLSSYDVVSAVEAPDDRTVRVRLREPDPDAVSEIFVNGQNGAIVPEHVLRGVTDLQHAAFDSAPIGSGPYLLDRWDRGTGVVMRANPRYFRGAPKTPRLDLLFIADANTLGLQVRTGAIDFAQIPPALVPQFRDVPHVRLLSAPSSTLAELEFNVHAAPFDDARVRRALGLAIDRARLARTVFHGDADVASGLLPPQSPFARADGPAEPPNPHAAAALLDAAGWRLDRGGVRHRAGMPLRFTLLLPSGNPTYLTLAVQLQSTWRALGVAANVLPEETSMLRAPDGPLARGRFQAVVSPFGFVVSADRSTFVTKGAEPPNGYNYSRYVDPAIDRASDAARATGDVVTRERLYAIIEAKLRDAAPIVPIVWVRYGYAIRDDLRGVRPEPVNSDFWNVYDWSLAPR